MNRKNAAIFAGSSIIINIVLLLCLILMIKLHDRAFQAKTENLDSFEYAQLSDLVDYAEIHEMLPDNSVDAKKKLKRLLKKKFRFYKTNCEKWGDEKREIINSNDRFSFCSPDTLKKIESVVNGSI